ncbi:MAG TPA: hypothetical protein VHW64_14715 [Nocardioides sp.]|uniref:hypothetical protein n=1 Tax=Nocardioides sp. TaxID=35761 RepID=UPI002E316D15|nr:hypothetical protein [Nocardioides sp.]HEX3931953.1 hypothetical protein [Nocardioides sp.]
MASHPPAEYGPEFLSWLRATTERAWREVDEPSLEDCRESGFIGAHWRRGTRWAGPLGEDPVVEAERRFGARFPAQCRLLLTTLHTTTPWMRGADHRSGELALHDSPGFYDWLDDEDPIRAALDRVADTAELAEELDAASGLNRRRSGGPSPQLLPVYGHRYVVGDESEWVLSIVGSDVIG